MPTPRAPKEAPVRESQEVGLSGGSPAEEKPPQENEIELVVVDRFGNREVRTVKELTYNLALKEAARMIYYDIADEIVEEVLEDLPRPLFWAYIYDQNTVYKVEHKRKHLTEVRVIPKHRAIYYFGGVEILGFDTYIPVEALYAKKQQITYYHVVRSTTAITAIREDLEKLLEGDRK
jgi:hypothetical protein